MADEYIDAPIEFDENALYNYGVARIQEYFPNWVPQFGSFADILLRTCASYAATGAEVASDVPFDIFRAFGVLAHDPPIDATPAVGSTVWTVLDTQGGYLIPAQTSVGLLLSTSTDDPVGFLTVEDAIVPAGSQTIQIDIVAAIPGANGSGLDSVIRADSLPFVTGVTLNGVTTDGNDAELSDDYVNRLSSDFELWTTTPIRGADFAKKARDIAGVFRCGYLENYDPVSGTSNNDKYVTLCAIDVDGNDVSSQVRQQIADYMNSLREVNFICPVVPATRTSIDVTAQVHVPTPQQQAAVVTEVQSALQSYLNPATWGAPVTGTGGVAPIWNNAQWLRYSRVMAAIEDVDGVDYASAVTMGITGGAMGNVDIAMPGAFPLPKVGTLSITAVTP